MHGTGVKICLTCFGVLFTQSSGRTSYYLHKVICFLLCVVYVTLLCYRVQHAHFCRFTVFFTMIKTMFLLVILNVKNLKKDFNYRILRF